MDPETSRKVNELAQNLKKLHLAATMEEAYKRAKEMIVGINPGEKSIGQMMEDKKAQKSEEAGHECVHKLESDIRNDEAEHEARSSEIKYLKKEVKAVKKGAEQVDEIVDEAEQAQS